MLKLTKRKTRLRTKTSASIDGRALIVELRPYSVLIHESGRRTTYEVDWESIYWLGAKKAAK